MHDEIGVGADEAGGIDPEGKRLVGGRIARDRRELRCLFVIPQIVPHDVSSSSVSDPF
jgi:hypothetical protein